MYRKQLLTSLNYSQQITQSQTEISYKNTSGCVKNVGSNAHWEKHIIGNMKWFMFFCQNKNIQCY